ncbi:MAG: xylulokinase [Rectinemataceae bacterium]
MIFLVVDLGTSGCRACLLRENGTLIAQAQESVAVSYGAGGVSGAAEIDADEALGRVCAASAAALDSAESSPPDGAGFSAILGWVLLDGEGKPLRPAMIWADTRATRESEALAARIGPELFYERSARRLSPELLLPELLWLKTHEAGTFGKLATVLSLKDYIVGRLTGTRATDRATASYTGFVDVDSLVEDESLLGTVGLRKGLLPRIASATELAGRASGEYARAAHLPEGTPVVLGSTDGSTAMYGSGVLLPGVAALVSGTTDVLMIADRERPRDPEMRLAANPAMVDGLFLSGGAMGFSCGTIDYFCSLFGTEIRDHEDDIARLPFDAEAPFALPGLSGERSPYWNANARGGLVGLGPGHGTAHILRAVMESTCFRLAALLELLGDSGLRPRRIAVSGGGSRSGAWNRLRAEVTGIPVERALRDEATVAGTALFLESALTGAGLVELSAMRIGFGEAWEPGTGLAEAYRVRRRRFESLLTVAQAHASK